MIGDLMREARPRQWAKNLLVFAAPGAAGVLGESAALGRVVLSFVAFCLASSGTYYWNDIRDREVDARHPTKRHRPVASGAVPVGLAAVVAALLLVAGLTLGLVLGGAVAAVIGTYVALTSVYSVILKHVAVVDLVVVAAGFVLRAMAGAEAADVEMSTWFLLFTSFASLFIVTGKRFAELRDLGDGAAAARPTLDDYTSSFLHSVVVVSLTASLLTYCLWAFESREVSGTTWPSYELSILPMAMALLRYLLVLDRGRGAAPEEVFLADRTLQVLGVLWAAVFAVGVYR